MKKLFFTTAWMIGLAIFANSSWAITAEALDNGLFTANADLFEPPDRPFVNLRLTMPQEGNVLALENFAVTEDGRSQVIRDFIPPESSGGDVIPVDIVFVHDESGSMKDEADEVKENIQRFLAELRDNNIDFRVSLVPYGGPDSSSTLSKPEGRLINGGNLYRDSASLIAEIENMQFIRKNFRERTFNALQLANNGIHWRKTAQRILILITDEGCDGNPLDGTSVPNCEGEPTKSQIIEQLKTDNVIVHSLIDIERNDVEEYKEISETTGGKVFDIFSSFTTILNDISVAILANYVLQYATDNLAQDGQLRTVELTVNANDDQGNPLPTTTFDADYIAYAPIQTMLTEETTILATIPHAEEMPIEIVAEIARPGTSSSITAFCFYAAFGQAFQSVQMTALGNNRYQAFIPANVVGNPFVSYYIQAQDKLNSRIFTLPSEGSNQPFMISVLPNEPPLITHTQVALVSTGQDAVISASVADTTNNVKQVTLYYRQTGRVVYQSISMGGNSQTDIQFTATIPGSAITANGLEYYIAAEDNLGATTTFGTLDNPIEPTINMAPVITHIPVLSIQEGENIVISAKVVDNQNVVTLITLYYKKPGDAVYQPIAIDYNLPEVDFTATIPGNEVTVNNVQYYIVAEDDFGATGRFGTPTQPLKVSVYRSSSGGGCAINKNADFDPILLILMILSIGYLVYRRYRHVA